MPVWCGIDGAEDHHDVALVDETGRVVASHRISDDPAGARRPLELLAEAGDAPGEPIPVALETPRGLLVACLRATGRPVYAINPLAVARYRDRHRGTRAKSARAAAVCLANILRTDGAAHRPLPADSEQVQALAVLARAQQDAVWGRQQLTNRLRSLLREDYPAFLEAFQDVRPGGLASSDARAVLAAAPTPGRAAALTRQRLRAALARGGRRRNVAAQVARLRAIFGRPRLHQPPLVEEAMGRQALALLQQLDAACRAADDLGEAATARFRSHPDSAIVAGFPGLGDLAGARVLAELGDDLTRFADVRGLRAYAGAAPVTRASGQRRVVFHRRVKNQRLAAAGSLWTLAALRASPGARALYDRRRAAGDRHAAAQRRRFGRFLGCLHHCLRTRQPYTEGQAVPTALAPAA